MMNSYSSSQLNLDNSATYTQKTAKASWPTPSIASAKTIVLRSQHKPVLVVSSIQKHSPHRQQVEGFIAGVFQDNHQATISDYLPELLACIDHQGISAAVGINRLGQRPVFCETYLNAPCEQVIEDHCGQPCQRVHIAELGNLASVHPGKARKLFCLLTLYLASRHIKWAVFTGTQSVYRGLIKTGLQPQRLERADKQRLKTAQQLWGNYYQHQPTVMAINIEQAKAHLDTQFTLDII